MIEVKTIKGELIFKYETMEFIFNDYRDWFLTEETKHELMHYAEPMRVKLILHGSVREHLILTTFFDDPIPRCCNRILFTDVMMISRNYEMIMLEYELVVKDNYSKALRNVLWTKHSPSNTFDYYINVENLFGGVKPCVYTPVTKYKIRAVST